MRVPMDIISTNWLRSNSKAIRADNVPEKRGEKDYLRIQFKYLFQLFLNKILWFIILKSSIYLWHDLISPSLPTGQKCCEEGCVEVVVHFAQETGKQAVVGHRVHHTWQGEHGAWNQNKDWPPFKSSQKVSFKVFIFTGHANREILTICIVFTVKTFFVGIGIGMGSA